jgi:hypothetical protein
MSRQLTEKTGRRGQLTAPCWIDLPPVAGFSGDVKDAGVLYREVLGNTDRRETTVLEVLTPQAMEKWTSEIGKKRPGVRGDGYGLKGFYTRQWMQDYILPCAQADDSVNIIVRKGDQLLGYLTGGPLEKYSLYHPRAGLGDTFMIVGLETLPEEGTSKGYAGSMVGKALERARQKGFRFYAGFTENPRLRHIYDNMPGMLLVDERRNVRGWKNLTYLLDHGLIAACKSSPDRLSQIRESELDTRPKKMLASKEEDELILSLRTKKGQALNKAARAMQDRLAEA